MSFKFSSLFSSVNLSAAFDSAVDHQAAHGRVAFAFVSACESEFKLTIPESKTKFSAFSEKFISLAKLGTGKNKAYPVTLAQGRAIVPALQAIRLGLGLPDVASGEAWIVPVKAAKVPAVDAPVPAVPAVQAVDAPVPAVDAPVPAVDAPVPAVDAPVPAVQAVDAPVPAELDARVTAFIQLIMSDEFTIAELQAIADACTLQAVTLGCEVQV